MQIAEILSDLTSLQVCDPAAALALVSARPSEDKGEKNSLTAVSTNDNDVDLKRAKDLMELHSTVKTAHQDGTDRGLEEARREVAAVMNRLA